MTTADNRIVLIGVGNIFRGDDGAGPAVAREIMSRKISGLLVIDQIGDGTDLMAAWDGLHTAYVVDCMRSGAAAGTVRRFEALIDDITEDMFPGYSTHAFSIPGTVELARILGRLPMRLILYGIEGRIFTAGADMCPEVRAAVATVADMIEGEIRNQVAVSQTEGGS